MALAAATIFECNTSATASNVNGGGFNPANANMLTDGAATSATGNSPVFSSASYNFVAGDVGHWVFIKSGTNWTPGWYKIASVAANAATLTATIGTAEQPSAGANVYINTVAGCATTASPTSATWTIDYSRSTTSPFASTDIAVVTTTTLTSVSNPFGKNMVGNLIHITAGTATAGWYEIVSVTIVTATIDRSATTTGVNNTGKVGGALSLNAASDVTVFGLGISASTSGARFFIKAGTYTIGATISSLTAGNSQWPITWEGYNTIRGDRPVGSNAPQLNMGTQSVTIPANYVIQNINFTGNPSGNFFLCGNICKILFCKILNSDIGSNEYALATGSTCIVQGCELISPRGRALQISTLCVVVGNYIHDSDSGIDLSTNSVIAFFIADNIVADCVTSAIKTSTAFTSIGSFFNNTFYGAENKLGSAIPVPSGNNDLKSWNNIFYGFVSAMDMSSATTSSMGYDDYNNYFNNTNDISDTTKWQKGIHDLAVNPSFTSIAQITGTGATSSNNVLTDAGANFSSVVNNQDYVYIVSGTGTSFVTGKYLITSHTTTTLTLDNNIASGAGSSIVYQITTGHNFLPTGAV